MDVGDYYFPDYDIGIERKTDHDFVSSFGKFHRQVTDLQKHYKVPIFLLQGNIKYDQHTKHIITWSMGRKYESKVKLSALMNTVVALQLNGVMFVHTYSANHTIDFVVDLHTYLGKGLLPWTKDKFFTTTERVMAGLKVVPGVGYSLAKELCQFSIAELSEMSVSDLQQINRVSEKIAEALYEYLHHSDQYAGFKI